jgi:hypothetical protein
MTARCLVKTSHQQVRYTGYSDATRINTNIYTQLLFSPLVSCIASWLFTLQRTMTMLFVVSQIILSKTASVLLRYRDYLCKKY